MGMFRKHLTTSDYTSNPNPKNFSIEKSVKIGDYWVSLIRYPDANNFEGNKILLTQWDPKSKTVIDPHFRDQSGIIARFEPTEFGWNFAIKAAEII